VVEEWTTVDDETTVRGEVVAVKLPESMRPSRS